MGRKELTPSSLILWRWRWRALLDGGVEPMPPFRCRLMVALLVGRAEDSQLNLLPAAGSTFLPDCAQHGSSCVCWLPLCYAYMGILPAPFTAVPIEFTDLVTTLHLLYCACLHITFVEHMGNLLCLHTIPPPHAMVCIIPLPYAMPATYLVITLNLCCAKPSICTRSLLYVASTISSLSVLCVAFWYINCRLAQKKVSVWCNLPVPSVVVYSPSLFSPSSVYRHSHCYLVSVVCLHPISLLPLPSTHACQPYPTIVPLLLPAFVAPSYLLLLPVCVAPVWLPCLYHCCLSPHHCIPQLLPQPCHPYLFWAAYCLNPSSYTPTAACASVQHIPSPGWNRFVCAKFCHSYPGLFFPMVYNSALRLTFSARASFPSTYPPCSLHGLWLDSFSGLMENRRAVMNHILAFIRLTSHDCIHYLLLFFGLQGVVDTWLCVDVRQIPNCYIPWALVSSVDHPAFSSRDLHPSWKNSLNSSTNFRAVVVVILSASILCLVVEKCMWRHDKWQ